MTFDEAYFGVLLPERSGLTRGKTKFKKYNIFDNNDVRCSIASYKTLKLHLDDPLFYCFNIFWHRSEYEMFITDGYREPIKIDVYSLFIEPNEEYLMKVVDMINLNDCKRWLKENKYGR